MRPVFVDHSGRRRRAVMILGSGLGVILVIGLIMLSAGLLTGTPIPLPGWPDAVQGEANNPAATPAVMVPRSPAPTVTHKPTTATTTAPVPATTGPCSGNGNGCSHRPTKSPGKP